METPGKAALMRIYTDERAKAEGSPLYQSIVERARTQPVAGLTVLRGVVGFGASGHVQRASILDLSGNLPLVVELVDEEAKLREFWRGLEGFGDIGLVTLEEVEVLHSGKPAISTRSGRADSDTAAQAYRVERTACRDDCYYLLASTPLEAIEIVTMHLANLEGRDAWTAKPETAAFEVRRGIVYDRAGQEVQPQGV